MRKFTHGGAVLLLIVLSACSNNNTSPTAPTPAATQASLTLSVAPSPITAVRCSPLCVGTSGATFPYSVSLVLNIQETAGVGGNINQVSLAPSIGTGVQSPLVYGPDIVVQRSGTNHVGARGTLSFPATFLISTVPFVVNVAVAFGDDKGNPINGTAQVTVN